MRASIGRLSRKVTNAFAMTQQQERRPPMFRPLPTMPKAYFCSRNSFGDTPVAASDSSSEFMESEAEPERCWSCGIHTLQQCGNSNCRNPCCSKCGQSVPWSSLKMCIECTAAAPQPNSDSLRPPALRSRSPHWGRTRSAEVHRTHQTHKEGENQHDADTQVPQRRTSAPTMDLQVMPRHKPYGKTMCPMCREYRVYAAFHVAGCVRCWSCCRCLPSLANYDALNPVSLAPRESITYFANRTKHWVARCQACRFPGHFPYAQCTHCGECPVWHHQSCCQNACEKCGRALQADRRSLAQRIPCVYCGPEARHHTECCDHHKVALPKPGRGSERPN